MPQSDAPGAAVGPPGSPVEPSPPSSPPPGSARRRGALLGLGLLVVVLLGAASAVWVSRLLLDDTGAASPGPGGSPSQSPRPGGSSAPNGGSASGSGTPTPDAAAGRADAVEALLADRARAVSTGDRALFLATVDPAATDFYAAQGRLFDRVAGIDLAGWSYAVTGDGPGFTAERAGELPTGSAIVRVRLTYRLAGTATTTDREQYLTVVPRGSGWLLASRHRRRTERAGHRARSLGPRPGARRERRRQRGAGRPSRRDRGPGARDRRRGGPGGA